MSNGSMNRNLFEFYHSQSRPRSEVWILKKIHAISDCQAEACLNDECANYKFKAVRGSNNNDFMFSYAGRYKNIDILGINFIYELCLILHITSFPPFYILISPKSFIKSFSPRFEFGLTLMFLRISQANALIPTCNV